VGVLIPQAENQPCLRKFIGVSECIGAFTPSHAWSIALYSMHSSEDCHTSSIATRTQRFGYTGSRDASRDRLLYILPYIEYSDADTALRIPWLTILDV
jgi:hypothetical protein